MWKGEVGVRKVIGGWLMLEERHFSASSENLHGYKENTAGKCIREGAGKVKPRL